MSSATTINPATGEELETYKEMSREDACAAVDACHEAFLDWKVKSLEERADMIRKLGQALRDNKEELAQLMTDEVGKLIGDSRDEVELCASICDYIAENGPKELADEQRDPNNAARGIVTYSPIGVVYGIQPWNFPAYQVIRYAIANLMTGNGVLLKHASNCTGSGLKIAEIFEGAGLPKNLFSVLVVSHDTSDAIIAHDKVRGVTLTGSDEGGKHVAEKAGKVLKPLVLELGSNDAYLVLEDADIDLAVKTCVTGRLYNNGETCVSAKRFVVTDAVYDEFVDAFVERMKSAKMGDPTKEDTQLGPVSSKEQFETLVEQVQKSLDGGCTLLCGGDPEDDPDGWYYPATVL
ncbi:MAG: aldehyde dehydrogenase family protein, partial [Parvularcula sp.]|nr:aldehyde dehydrogenase family protein [Parvularcula sp.]